MQHIDFLQNLAREVHNAGGELWVIGGTVRETLFQQAHPDIFVHPSKDLDCEVYGVEPDVFEAIITQLGDVDFIGKQFGVYHLDTYDGISCDFNFPRSDSKGRRPEVEVDVHMNKYDACKRRNFTCNSAMYNPLDGELVDYFEGRSDIAERMLRVTSQLTFADDPLRPLIGMFLAGAYGFGMTEATKLICQEMVWRYADLPKDRIWGEWWKWATRSIVPSQGLLFLKATNWIRNCPELDILDTIPQDPEWHPEGNVWRHTLLACNWAAKYTQKWDSREEAGIVVLAALCHDLDKAITTTQNEEGRIVSPGHDEGIEAEKFLDRVHCPGEIKEQVLALVRTHMLHISGAKPRTLVKKLGKATPLMWLTVVSADHSARPPLPVGSPIEAQLLFAKAIEVKPEEVKPIVTGKHLMMTGIKAGPALGGIVKNIFEMGQLEGEFSDLASGLEWAFQKGFITNIHDGAGCIREDILGAKRNK